MRRSILGLTALALAIGGPTTAYAGVQLAPIMHAWRSNLHVLEATPPAPDDKLRRAIQSYIDDASMVAGRLSGSGAQAQDFRHRFVAMAAAGRTALGDVGHPNALRADTARIKANCASCHAVYNN